MVRRAENKSGRKIIFRLVAAILVAQPAAQATIQSTNPYQETDSIEKLVRATVANEVAASNDPSKHMFRSRKQTAQGSQTRLYVETREAMAGMTIAYNDRPLDPAQMQGEKDRLNGLAGSSEQLRQKHAHEQETAQHTLQIVKALPEAFQYDYDGVENGTSDVGEPGVSLVRLKFRPNPSYQPPTHVEQVLVGMQGIIEIDPVAKRLARIDGTLFREVSFGWGILGHLDRGGHFLVEQRDVGNGCWEISHMSLNFSGKILMFKSIAIRSDEVFSDFRRIPSDTSFAQGVRMLEAEEVKLAQNQEAGTASGSRLH